MKKWILLASLALATRANAAPCVVTPSTPTVTIGSQIQFTATGCTPAWSLAAGSSGTINGSGLYTAPTTYFQASNLSSAGTQLGPNDAIWNTDISAFPIDATSAQKFQHWFNVNGGSGTVNLVPNIPRNQYATGVSSQAMTFRSTPQYTGTYFFMRSSFTRIEEASVMSNQPVNNQDHHILGVSTDTLLAYEQYQFYPAGADPGAPTSNSTSGCIYDPNNYFLPDASAGAGTCTNAAGLPFQPFLLRNSELESGQIHHMLYCTLNNANLYNTSVSSAGFVWPATNHAQNNNCTSSANCFAYGSVIRLHSSYSCSDMSAGGQAICGALKKYGCIWGDGTSGTVPQIATDFDLVQSTRDFQAVFTDFTSAVSTISSSDFDLIDLSSLQLSSFTTNTNPSNAFARPPQFVQVIVKNTIDNSISSTTVALQPVVVGWQNPAHQGLDTGIVAMAGTPQFLIPAWVTGSTDTVFNCAMNPTVGTLTTSAAGCLYTPPASQYNQVLITTFTITSRIDPNHNAATFFMTVFSTDGVRERFGPAISGADTQPPYNPDGSYTDATTGNRFFEEPTEAFSDWYTRNTQGSASWPTQLMNNFSYGSGDKLFAWMAPAGSYTLVSHHGANNTSDVNASSACIESQNVVTISTTSLAQTTFVDHALTSNVSVGSNNTFHWRIVGNDASSHVFISYFTFNLTPAVGAANPVLSGKTTLTGKTNLSP